MLKTLKLFRMTTFMTVRLVLDCFFFKKKCKSVCAENYKHTTKHNVGIIY